MDASSIPNTDDAAFDFPSASPAHFYIVSSTWRSGGTLICNELWKTGVLGAPSEYFNLHGTMFHMAQRFKVESINDYLTRLFEVRTSPNKVFGVKVHWDQLQLLLISDMIFRFRAPKWISIERHNLVAQCVSHAKAMQTNQYHSFDKAVAEPEYNFEKILRIYRRLVSDLEQRRAFFLGSRLEPHVVVYEDYLENPTESLTRICTFLGFPNDPRAVVGLPRLARQADQYSAEWIERFKRDATRHGINLTKHSHL